MPDKIVTTPTFTETEIEERLIGMVPLGIADNFKDYPGKSEMVYIVSSCQKFIIAQNVYRPLACMLIDAFNKKYGAING